MAVWLVVHLPHIVPPIIAFALLSRFALMMADTPPAQLSDEEVAEWKQVRAERAYARRVRRSTSRLGLLSLPLLALAFGSGLWLYTIALRDDRPGSALIWAHVAVSVLGLLLASWKIVELGWTRLRRGLDLRRAFTDGISLLLLALGGFLLLTGAALLLVPSSDSVAAYTHLITSVWWGVFLGVHLMRYLGRSMDAALRGKAAGEGRPPAKLDIELAREHADTLT